MLQASTCQVPTKSNLLPLPSYPSYIPTHLFLCLIRVSQIGVVEGGYLIVKPPKCVPTCLSSYPFKPGSKWQQAGSLKSNPCCKNVAFHSIMSEQRAAAAWWSEIQGVLYRTPCKSQQGGFCGNNRGSMSVSPVVSVALWDNFTRTQDTLFLSNVCLSEQERMDLNASVKITNTAAILAPGCSHTCQS